MSKTIDQRIVEMQFDNKNFEKNVSQSMSTLDKLKSSLNFSGAAKAVDELNNSTSKLNFSPLTNALDTVSSKFSALETIAVGALLKIGSQIADTGVQLVKSLSVDNVSAGWNKFGEKTTSVATLVAQGNDLDKVNEQLARLNWFTDETSYEFTKMVQEISKFSAAGQSLEDSVTAMQGIASWAALSGQNAQTASRAMYQLSQAMGAGVMRREDYKSIQNVSMDTMEFRQRAIDAAIALGTLEEVSDGVYKSLVADVKDGEFTIEQFAEHLTEDKWFTSDVMMMVYKDYGKAANTIMAYVDKYADDTEHKISTASEAMDDIEQKAKAIAEEMVATGEYLTVDDAMDAALLKVSLDEMREVPEVYDKAIEHMESYNKELIDSYNASIPQGQKAIETLEEAIAAGLEVIPSVDDSLIDLGYGLDAFSLKALRAGQEARTFEDVLNSVKDAVSTGWMTTFENIFGNYDEAKTLWTDLANELYDVFAEGGNERNAMLSAWKEMGGRNLLFANTDEETGAFWNLYYALTDVINAAKEAFNDVFPPMTAERLYEITEKFKEFTDRIKLSDSEIEQFKNIFGDLFAMIKNIGNVALPILRLMKDNFTNMFPAVSIESIAEIVKKIRELTDTFKITEDQLSKFSSIFNGIFSIIKKIGEIISKVFVSAFDVLLYLFNNSSGSILDFFAKIGDIITDISNKIDESNGIETVFSSIVDFLKGFIDTVKSIINEASTYLNEHLGGIVTDLGSVVNTVGEFTESVKNFFGSLSDSIKNNSGETKTFGSIFTGVFSFILDLLKKIPQAFKGIIQAASDTFSFLEPIITALSGVVGNIITQLGDAVNSLLDDIAHGNTDLSSFFDALILIFDTGVFMAILNGVKRIKVQVQSFKSQVKDVFGVKGLFTSLEKATKSLTQVFRNISQNVNMQTIKTFAISIAILAAALLVLTRIDPDALDLAIRAITTLFIDLISSFVIVNKTSSKLKTLNTVSIGLALIEMSISLLILAAALKKIAAIGLEGLEISIIAVGVCLKLMANALNNVPTEKGLVAKATAYILVSIAFINLGKALKKIGELSLDQVAGAIIGLYSATKLMVDSLNGVRTEKGLVAKAISFIAVSIAFIALGKALKNIGEMSFEEVITSVVGLFAAMEIMVQALNSVKTEKGLVTKAISFIAVSIAFIALGKALKNIGEMSFEDVATSVVGLFLAMEIMVKAINSVKNEKGLVTKAISFIAVSIAFIALGKALKNIGEMSFEEVITSVVGLFAAMEIMVRALNSVKTEKGLVTKAISFIAVSIAFMALGETLVNIGEMSFEDVVTSVVGLFAAMEIMIKALNSVKNEKGLITKAASFIVVSLAFASLAKVIKSLGDLSFEQAATAILSLAITIGVLVAAVNSIGDASQATAFFTLSIAMMLLAKAMTSLAEVPFIQLLGAVAAFAAMFAIIGIAAKVLAPMTASISSLASSLMLFSISFSVFSAAGLLFGAALLLISLGISSLVVSIVGFVQAIPVIIVGLVDSIVLLAKNTPTLIEALVSVLQGLVQIIPSAIGIVFALIKSILDGIVQIVPEIVDDLFKILDTILSNLFERIPKIVDDVIKILVVVLASVLDSIDQILPMAFELLLKLLDGLVAYSPQIITKLVDLVINLLDGLAERVPDLFDSIVNLVDAIFDNILGAIGTIIGNFIGSIVDGIGQVITAGLPKIGENLSKFSEAIGPFIDMTGSISEDSMKGVKLLAETILLITAAELLNSLSDFMSFFGGSTSTTFGESIVSFGKSMVEFADITKDIDSTKVAGSAMAAKALAEFANNLPKEGGLWQDFFGTGNLTKFGEELASFAPHFVSYANEVAKIEDMDAVTTSANAAKSLADFANNLPKHDGVWQEWVGDSSLTTFAKELEDFAPALVGYAETVRGINTADVQNSIDAAKILADFATNLPDHGGVVQWFMGDSTLSSFAAELDAFAPSLVSYAETVKGLDGSVIEKSAAAAGALSALESGLSDSGGVVAFFAGDNTLKGFGQSLEAFGQSFSIYYNSVVGINPDNIKGVTEATKDFVDICLTMQQVDIEVPERFGEVLERLGYALIDGFSTAFTGGKAQLDSAINEAIQTVYDKFEADRLSFLRYGEYFMEDLITGVANKNDRVINVAKNVSNNLKNQFNNKQIEFKTLGEYLAQGFIDGFEGKTDDVKNKATAVANAAIEAMKEALNEHSPSRVMYSIGEFAGQGFVNALTNYVDVSANAGEDIATAATDSLRDALAQSAAAFDTSVDVQPTIKPVLDLSNIDEGIGQLDGMFDANRSIALAGSANLAMEAAAGDIQNEIKVDNSDVVTAITDLQTDMADMVDKITNMQIYLDKNVLVGQMAAPMDKALGTNYRRNLRQ